MEVDVTRFIKGKMLIFSKLSLKSFSYDFADTICFSNKEIQEIYNQYSINKCHIYLNFTDTDSCSFWFWNWLFD